MLAEKLSASLVLVGDPNQSIYGFQGGSSRFLLEHPGFCVQSVINYRSTPEIVDILNSIMPIPLAHGLRMTSSLSSSRKPCLLIGSMRGLLGDILGRVKDFLRKGIEGKTLAVIGPVKRSTIQNDRYSSISLNKVLKHLLENDVPCLRHYKDSDLDGEKAEEKEKAGGKNSSIKATAKDISSWSKIHFLTVHASKGLEFDEVILLNYQLNTQNCRPQDEDQYRSYEYIWYVGFSRPKETLTVYHLKDNRIWPGYENSLYQYGKMNAFDVSGSPIKF
jgi:superfamily I DNA/RNA helicase